VTSQEQEAYLIHPWAVAWAMISFHNSQVLAEEDEAEEDSEVDKVTSEEEAWDKVLCMAEDCQ